MRPLLSLLLAAGLLAATAGCDTATDGPPDDPPGVPADELPRVRAVASAVGPTCTYRLDGHFSAALALGDGLTVLAALEGTASGPPDATASTCPDGRNVWTVDGDGDVAEAGSTDLRGRLVSAVGGVYSVAENGPDGGLWVSFVRPDGSAAWGRPLATGVGRELRAFAVLADADPAAATGVSALYVLYEGVVRKLSPDGAPVWASAPLGEPRPHLVEGTADGGALVATGARILRLGPDGAVAWAHAVEVGATGSSDRDRAVLAVAPSGDRGAWAVVRTVAQGQGYTYGVYALVELGADGAEVRRTPLDAVVRAEDRRNVGERVAVLALDPTDGGDLRLVLYDRSVRQSTGEEVGRYVAARVRAADLSFEVGEPLTSLLGPPQEGAPATVATGDGRFLTLTESVNLGFSGAPGPARFVLSWVEVEGWG